LLRKIKLTQGKYALVDDADYDRINKYNWYFTHYGYAARKTPKAERDKGRASVIYMHREILNAMEGSDVDHVDGNRLNNQSNNLRICSRSENLRNQRKAKNTTSKYKGVCWQERDKKWQVYIYHGKKNHYLGYFDKEEDAAGAYNEEAIKHHGEYAYLNKIS